MNEPTFKIIGLLFPEQAKLPGVVTPIPVLDLPVADQRKWCAAALRWLAHGERPRHGCPTASLRSDGSCKRSPSNGPCLLLLPGDHTDWLAARRYQLDESTDQIVDRPDLAPPAPQTPLPLAELNPPLHADRVLDELTRLRIHVAADLAMLAEAGYPIAVDAETVVQAEMQGYTVNLETGAREASNESRATSL